MEDDKLIMDELPIIGGDCPAELPQEEPTLIPTDEVIPAPETPAECCAASSITPAMFCGTLQESVTITWRFHLKTRKYSEHKDLNDFYENALKHVDDIIEQYQGANGVISEPYTNCVVGEGKTAVEYLQELKTFIVTNKAVLGDSSEINSAIDTFLGDIDSTLYKLINLTESTIKDFDAFCYEDYPELKESCKYDRFGERSCDDPDDPDYDPDYDDAEDCGEECGEEE